jgi:transposase
MARSEGSKEQLEARRKNAVRMLQNGLNPSEVAEIVGVSRQSVYRWKNTYEEEGWEGLDAKENPNRGCDPKLPDEKLPELEELLLEGAEAHGFEGQLWTLPRVVRLIDEQFDSTVSIWSARRYLEKLNWSNQRPQRRAAERDPEKIKEWRDNWQYREKKPSDSTKL